MVYTSSLQHCSHSALICAAQAFELLCAGGVTTIAGDLGLARTGLFSKTDCNISLRLVVYKHRKVSALRRTFASHQSSFRSWDFPRLAELTSRGTRLLSGDRCRCGPLVILLWQPQDCTTVGSSDLLRSAVENVIRNAIRHTAQQTEIEVRLTCETNDAASTATISVRGHGPGVPESSLEELFRPFFRLDESRECSTGGVGLGLAIAQRAVKLHGGEIKAQNCAGRGLEVVICFPVPRPDPCCFTPRDPNRVRLFSCALSSSRFGPVGRGGSIILDGSRTTQRA
jgi:Histidine kinase-, DNA gyrase B-, and HSP90-like ATPase